MQVVRIWLSSVVDHIKDQMLKIYFPTLADLLDEFVLYVTSQRHCAKMCWLNSMNFE